MIDAAGFRRIRRHVMKSLAPDFLERKGIYTRKTEYQLHCIQFASGKRGNQFCVDIGIHFARLPGFEAFGCLPNPQHPEPDTCCFKRRWRNADNEQLFPYGDSGDDAEQFVSTIARDCLATFEQFNASWANGDSLLGSLPPETLRSDAALFKQLMDSPDPAEKDRLSSKMAIRKLFPGWLPHVPQSVSCSHILRKKRVICRPYPITSQSPRHLAKATSCCPRLNH